MQNAECRMKARIVLHSSFLFDLHSALLLAAPQKARPAERTEPLRGHVTSGMFARQMLHVGMHTFAAHLRRRDIPATHSPPHCPRRRAAEPRRRGQRGEEETGFAVEPLPDTETPLLERAILCVLIIELAANEPARYRRPHFTEAEANSLHRQGPRAKKAVAQPCATAPLEVGQHHTTTTLLPGERLKGAGLGWLHHLATVSLSTGIAPGLEQTAEKRQSCRVPRTCVGPSAASPSHCFCRWYCTACCLWPCGSGRRGRAVPHSRLKARASPWIRVSLEPRLSDSRGPRMNCPLDLRGAECAAPVLAAANPGCSSPASDDR